MLLLSTAIQGVLFIFSEASLASGNLQVQSRYQQPALCGRNVSEQDRALILRGVLQNSSLYRACSMTILSVWIPYPHLLSFVVSQQLMAYSELAKFRDCPRRHQIGVMKFISLTMWPLPLQYFLPSGARGWLLH